MRVFMAVNFVAVVMVMIVIMAAAFVSFPVLMRMRMRMVMLFLVNMLRSIAAMAVLMSVLPMSRSMRRFLHVR